MANTDVKNNIIKPFDTIFMIVFGFVLTEHIKNLVQLIVEKKGGGLIFLSIVIFLVLFLAIIETVLDYSNSEEKIVSNKVIPNLLRHMVWFFQFFPIYYIVDVLVSDKVTIEDKSEQISFSMMIIYLLYFVINALKLIGTPKKERDDIYKNLLLYILFAFLFFASGMSLTGLEFHPATILSLMILLVLVIYIIYWRKYYKTRLFEPAVVEVKH